MGFRIYKIKIPFWTNFYYWLEMEEIIWELLIHIGLFLQILGMPFINRILIIFMLKHVAISLKKFKKVEIHYVVSINF